ncbi:glycosyltransferase [Streptosporangium soli]|nr:glycosyltransferase [Streptosporangium sp. KLBMP 9127]
MAVLARCLVERGHRVTVFVEARHARPLTGIGADVVNPARWSTGGPVPGHVVRSGDAGAMFRHLFFGSVADMALDIGEALRMSNADLLVSDVFMPGGGMAAERAGLPWASLSCSPVPVLDAGKIFIEESLRPCFEVEGMRESLLALTSPYLHLIPATPGFAGPVDFPSPVALTGPLVGAPRGGLARGGQTIAVTTSSAPRGTLRAGGPAQDHYIRVVIEAFGGTETEVVVFLPTGTDPASLPVPPPNVRLIEPADHDEVFDRCSAVVTHAGWGTVSRALRRGLPLVLLPLVNDQGYIARRCAELRLGVALDPGSLTAQTLREAVDTVVGSPVYRSAAVAFAAGLEAAPPAQTAAHLIESLL